MFHPVFILQGPCSYRSLSSQPEPSGGILTAEFHIKGTVQHVVNTGWGVFNFSSFRHVLKHLKITTFLQSEAEIVLSVWGTSLFPLFLK